MLARSLERGGERNNSSSSMPPTGRIRSARFAFGERAGLIDHERVDLLQRSSASAFLISTPACAPRPIADHDRHRRGEPEGARAGDDQHRDGVDECVGEARLGPHERPDDEGQQSRSPSTAGTK